jgi:antitoxin VapB
MQSERHVRLFRSGPDQTLIIPADLELPTREATIRKEGRRLVIEPVQQQTDLETLLTGWGPMDEPFPDVDEGLLPLDDVRL